MTPFAERLLSVLKGAKQAIYAAKAWPRDAQELHDASPYLSLADGALCYATVHPRRGSNLRGFQDGPDLTKEVAVAMLGRLRSELLTKNQAYGNSATNPVRRWSAAPAVEGILIRLDDKLSRLLRGSDAGEDTLFDFCGYLALLEIARLEETTP